MIIKHQGGELDLPSLGFIRPKPIGDGQTYEVSFYPPGPGPLMGAEPATQVDLTVDADEVARMKAVAPHLFTGEPRLMRSGEVKPCPYCGCTERHQ